jgi:hypothetical protein
LTICSTASALERFPPIKWDCWRIGLYSEPEVPEGKWFKKFSGMTVCGEGEMIKTFLQPGQIAAGQELN